MKTCTKCGIEKELSEFYKRKSSSDGRRSECKECEKGRAKKWYSENTQRALDGHRAWLENQPDYHREHARKWAEDNRERSRAKKKEWYYNNTEKAREYGREYHSKHPERITAGRKINQEVKMNRMPHVSTCICKDCGLQAAHYHHEDYSKPLDVVPLCVSCHRRRHSEYF